jgi:ABC-type Co2+ transport system permease subunit
MNVLGPGSIAIILIVVGFLGAVGYQAWKQGSGFTAPTRDFVAFAIVITFIVTIGYMMLDKITESMDILVGALIAAFSAVVAVYFNKENK